MKFGWIQEQAGQFEVSIMCDVLQVSRSGYYAWVDRPPCARTRRREELIEQIRQANAQSFGTYGSPRIQAELAGREIGVCVNTVAKLMKEAGIPAAVVMELVGHDSEAMSRHYTHIGADALRKAAASLPDITMAPT